MTETLIHLSVGGHTYEIEAKDITPVPEFIPTFGHYMAMSNKVTDRVEFIEELVSHPGVQGIQIARTWRQLELTEGEYTLDNVKQNVAECERLNKKCTVRVNDKTFGGGEKAVPDYLDLKYPQHAPFNIPTAADGSTSKGHVGRRWVQPYSARYMDLMKAMADEFNSNPHFEMILANEDAISPNAAKEPDYDAQKYVDSINERTTYMALVWDRTSVGNYHNFIAKGNEMLGVQQVVEHTAWLGCYPGGPDWLSGSKSLDNNNDPKKLYHNLRNAQQCMIAMQNDSFSYRGTPADPPPDGALIWTLQALFADAVKELKGLRYMVWNKTMHRKYPDSFIWTDALPVIEANPEWWV